MKSLALHSQCQLLTIKKLLMLIWITAIGAKIVQISGEIMNRYLLCLANIRYSWRIVQKMVQNWEGTFRHAANIWTVIWFIRHFIDTGMDRVGMPCHGEVWWESQDLWCKMKEMYSVHLNLSNPDDTNLCQYWHSQKSTQSCWKQKCSRETYLGQFLLPQKALQLINHSKPYIQLSYFDDMRWHEIIECCCNIMWHH